MLTHRNMTNTAWSISTYIGNVADDVILCALPLSFDYGLYQVITGARVGFTVVLEASFAFPFQVLKDVQKWRVTGFPGVPTIFATILQMTPLEGLDLSSIRYLTNTAAVLPPDHIRRLQELLPAARIFSMYGLTECTRVCYLDPALINEKIGSVGKAMPNSEIYLVDDDGKRLPNGSTGKLVLRGANVMRGYWGKPAETARLLREGEIPGEMVMHSGDVFRTDEEGFLYFQGRSDDIFKCKGEKVSPREIEDVLHASPLIAEAAVVGTPDPVDGMAVKAVVVPKPGAALTEQEVRRICRAHLESHLVPKFVEIRTELPKTDTCKVKKADLV
jgi:acyl-CoA synthetase (AMP-forming)/AMP-acid ligase II